MTGAGEQSIGRLLFDYPPGVHDRYPVADRGRQLEVVGDEHQPELAALAQAVEDPDDLRLDRHVERRGRLVGDQQGRFGGQRHCDQDALEHPTGELERVGAHHPLRITDADLLE